MSAKTGIEWCDATWNPIRGCSRVSEGCRNCYAEQVAARFNGPGQPYEGLATVIGGKSRWTGRVITVPRHQNDPIRWRKPRRIFVNSMSDLFHEKLTDEQIDLVFVVMAIARRHTFQILTKRPDRMREYLSAPGRLEAIYAQWYGIDGGPREVQAWPLPNVWLGVSVEHQDAADARIPVLLDTPAAVRWISAEPLLGPISLISTIGRHRLRQVGVIYDGDVVRMSGDLGLDWVVVGGESGREHRPMELRWLAEVVEQCKVGQVPVFVKQDSGPKSGQQGRIPDELWALKQFPQEDAVGV